MIDIVLAIPIVYLTYKGWRRGLVREIATLAGVLAGIWASVHLSQEAAEAIGLEGEYAILAAFFVCFVGALVLAYLIGRLVEGLMKASHLSTVNRIAGAAVGMLKALCILAVVLNGIVMIDRKQVLLKPDMKERSILYKPVYNAGNELTSSLKEYIEEHGEEWKESLTGESQKKKQS